MNMSESVMQVVEYLTYVKCNDVNVVFLDRKAEGD